MKTKVKRLWKVLLEEFALLSAELIAVLILAISASYLFYKMSSLLLNKEVRAIDTSISEFVFSFRSESMNEFMQGVTLLGNFEVVIFPAIILAAYFLFIKPHRWYSILVPVVSIGSISWNLLLKSLYDRPRPKPIIADFIEASGLSFPSGHAMFSISFYGLLIYVSRNYIKSKKIKYLLISVVLLIILFIGISRIYLEKHYASDVIAGFAAGLLWLLASILVIRFVENRVKKQVSAGVRKQDK